MRPNNATDRLLRWLLHNAKHAFILTLVFVGASTSLFLWLAHVDWASTRFAFARTLRYQHEGDVVALVDSSDVRYTRPLPAGLSVALGCAITTRGALANLSRGHFRPDNYNILSDKPLSLPPSRLRSVLKTLPLFTDLLPSFCATANPTGFKYFTFLAYDYDDPVLAVPEAQRVFEETYWATINATCPKALHVRPHFVKCTHRMQPAQAQNDAMLAAYAAGVDYFYRVNDDTLLVTPNWTEIYIRTLLSFRPPNVGVVGPQRKAKYDNTYILTYDFVHRTHVDVFGFYYPPVLTDWFADDWITHVYQPGRSVLLLDVLVHHTQSLGRRYKVRHASPVGFDELLERDVGTLNVWLAAYRRRANATHPPLS